MHKKLHRMARLARHLLAPGLAAAALSASAAYLDSPVPANAYITKGGLDWAWAFPLPASSGLDLSYQAGQGWRLPTPAELANAPLATEFMKAGANVPLGSSDPVSGASFSATNANLTGPAACATPYFSNSYRHCDWQDGLGQPYGPWVGMAGANSSADQLVVRDSATPAAAVPVPTLGSEALVLLSLSLAAIGWASKGRKR